MKKKVLQKKYDEILKIAELATGRKETVSLFHKAEKIRSKISKKFSFFNEKDFNIKLIKIYKSYLLCG